MLQQEMKSSKRPDRCFLPYPLSKTFDICYKAEVDQIIKIIDILHISQMHIAMAQYYQRF